MAITMKQEGRRKERPEMEERKNWTKIRLQPENNSKTKRQKQQTRSTNSGPNIPPFLTSVLPSRKRVIPQNKIIPLH